MPSRRKQQPEPENPVSGLTRSDGVPLPDDIYDKLLVMLADSPLHDKPLTAKEKAAVDRAMGRLKASNAAKGRARSGKKVN